MHYHVSMLLLTSGCKLAPAQYKLHYYLAPPQNLSKKQIKIKLMLCKPIFIIHGRVNGLLKVILQYKNEAPQFQKWVRHMHNDIIAIYAKFQVSVQILLYNKIKQTRNK